MAHVPKPQETALTPPFTALSQTFFDCRPNFLSSAFVCINNDPAEWNPAEWKNKVVHHAFSVPGPRVPVPFDGATIPIHARFRCGVPMVLVWQCDLSLVKGDLS
jgi:hypothetical protein